MKEKYFWRVLIGAFLFSMLSACGGGGGGGGGGPVPLATGTFTKTVEIAPSTTNYGFLFDASNVENRYMFLLTAADINGSGKVRSVRFKYNATLASGFSCPNTTIKMGATTVADLSATYASNVNQGAGSFTTVLSNAAVTIPAGSAGSYFNIDVATPFDYNGKDNLIVEVTRSAACTGSISVSAVATGGYNGVVWAAGGAGTSTTAAGTAQTNSMHMQLVFAGGDDKLNYGGAVSNSWPFDNVATGTGGAGSLRIQNLYLASEINGSGPITGIAFQTNATTVAGAYTYTLKLGHSTLAALTTTFANNYTGSLTTVANAVTNFTIPAGIPSGEWLWVPIPDGVFTYNGTDNLLVEVATTAGTASNILRTYTAFANRRAAANGATATTAGSVDNSLYHIALRFNGGMVAKLSLGNGNNNAIFAGTLSTATLYSATDLGTAGSITSVSCRLWGASTAASYANFKVVMGHSTVSALSGTAATDFVSQNTVFSGTVAVPAGLLAGDWIDIPLTSAFAYDGKRNLIVWMGNGGAASGTAVINNCQGENNATRYPSGLGLSATGVGSATYGLNNWTTDIRMTIQK